MRASTLVDIRTVLGVALLAGATPRALCAQKIVPTFDVGASSVRFDDRSVISTTTANPGLRIESASTTFQASVTHSNVTSGGWATQGALGLSSFFAFGGRFYGELVGGAAGSADNDETRTGQVVGQARGHFIGAVRGFWVGGGAGTAWDGVAPHRLALLDAGAWVRSRNATLLAAVAPTSITAADRTPILYADASVAARWVARRVELGATLGARIGDTLPAIATSSSTWGSVTAALWIAGPIAVVASAGSYPIDYTQGYPGGRFAAVGLRLARRPVLAPVRSEGSRDALVASALASAAPTEPSAGFAVEGRDESGLRTITVSASAAQFVEVSGSFTGWEPVRLTRRRDGRWVATLAIPPGTHEIALRIDGGPWLAPPGLTAIRDEFGGLSGILVVEK